jgi:NADP-dependent aldehyde dehydrogenase
VFSSVYLSHDDVIKLVQHPVIKAVGFTGSRNVGMRLFRAAVSRPDPIAVYAEMSSINPVVLMEHALQNQKEKIAKELSASVLLGAGQFCTNPGIVLLVESEAANRFLEEFADQIKVAAPATMLNKNICKAYNEGVKALQNAAEISVLATASKAAASERFEAQPIAHIVSGQNFLSKKEFSEEVFGPATLIVLCKTQEEMHQILQSMEGQLTASVHAEAGDKDLLKTVINIIIQKAGRLIYEGYPTGVEVCHSMHHGGPFPSTTDAKFTSVGTAAIYRFVRPVAFQDFPDELLPDPLKNNNPLNILRLVDGNWTQDAQA